MMIINIYILLFNIINNNVKIFLKNFRKIRFYFIIQIENRLGESKL